MFKPSCIVIWKTLYDCIIIIHTLYINIILHDKDSDCWCLASVAVDVNILSNLKKVPGQFATTPIILLRIWKILNFLQTITALEVCFTLTSIGVSVCKSNIK